MLKEFRLTDEEWAEMKAIANTPLIMIGGTTTNPQEAANAFWRKLGERYGFDPMSVQPKGRDPRDYIATVVDKNPIVVRRFEGGPLDGMTAPSTESWPFPPLYLIPGVSPGAYVKDSDRESKLTDEFIKENPFVARGAVFVWSENVVVTREDGEHHTA